MRVFFWLRSGVGSDESRNQLHDTVIALGLRAPEDASKPSVGSLGVASDASTREEASVPALGPPIREILKLQSHRHVGNGLDS